jgi:hypothetical protein
MSENSAKLRTAFATLMERAGKPIERAPGRHGLAQVYRTRNGKTVHLRTNRKPALVTLADAGGLEARMSIEDADYVGIAFMKSRSKIAGYLVPSREAARRIRDDFARWLEQPGHSADNRMRVLKFTGSPGTSGHGYQETWARYCIGEIDAREAPAETAAPDDLSDLKAEIARRKNVTPEQVEISIRF